MHVGRLWRALGHRPHVTTWRDNALAWQQRLNSEVPWSPGQASSTSWGEPQGGSSHLASSLRFSPLNSLCSFELSDSLMWHRIQKCQKVYAKSPSQPRSLPGTVSPAVNNSRVLNPARHGLCVQYNIHSKLNNSLSSSFFSSQSSSYLFFQCWVANLESQI